MANVYTKKYHRPRTTTLTDFSGRSLAPSLPRIPSPTRRGNPHPTGLVTQSPYNRDNAAFDIWNPSHGKFLRRYPEMMKHICQVNFCCRPLGNSSSERTEFLSVPKAIHSKKPPVIRYTLDTISRIAYGPPSKACPDGTNCLQKNSRFGYSPNKGITRGIVPNTFPSILPSADDLYKKS